MKALLHTIAAPPVIPFNRLPPKAQLARCSRENVNQESFLEPSAVELEGHGMDILQESRESTSRSRSDMSSSDIRKLFNDAQRNILYLNKQRINAIEELNKLQKENKSLHSTIQELGAKIKTNPLKGSISKYENAYVQYELLLRIDSMVVSGLIRQEEVTDLRRLVMDNSIALLDAFSDTQLKNDMVLLTELRQFLDRRKRNSLHIIHICTEMAPVASHGSLASYVTGLSHALQRKGNLVEVILPKYSSLLLDEIWGLRKVEAEVLSFFAGHWHGNRIWTGVVSGIPVTFIEPLHHSTFFDRNRMYGYSDDFERFTYFSRASLDYLVKSGKQPDILHIHNWETAIVGPLFWDIFVKQGLGGTRIMFTCQGFSSQCLEKPEKLTLCGLDPHRLHRPDRLQDNMKSNLINILKGGVVYSNKVVMASSVYSKDRIIRTLSHGLDSTLSIHKDKFVIAPYGYDDILWDPSRDKFLPRNYSADDLTGKAVCKIWLQQRLGLDGDSTPIVGCMDPVLSDAVLDSFKAALWLAIRKGAQVVFASLREKPGADLAFHTLKEEFKYQKVWFVSENDPALYHLLFAGSDIILCPSFHDPVQQIPHKAIKYGAAPIAVHFSHPEDHHDFGDTNMSRYILSTFGNMSLSEALDQITNDPLRWEQKIKDGMSKDFSWNGECCDIHLASYFSIKSL